MQLSQFRRKKHRKGKLLPARKRKWNFLPSDSWEAIINEKKDSPEFKLLLSRLDQTRKDFAAKEYETASVLSRLRLIFSARNLKTNHAELPEVKNAKDAYDKCSRALLDYQLNELDRSSFSGKRLEAMKAALKKFHKLDEKNRMSGARSEARASNWCEKVHKSKEDLAKKSEKMVENSLNFFKEHGGKVMVAGVAISLIPGLEGVGGAAVGVGVGAKAEKFAENRQSEKEKAEKTKAAYREMLEEYGLDKNNNSQEMMLGILKKIFLNRKAAWDGMKDESFGATENLAAEIEKVVPGSVDSAGLAKQIGDLEKRMVAILGEDGKLEGKVFKTWFAKSLDTIQKKGLDK